MLVPYEYADAPALVVFAVSLVALVLLLSRKKKEN